MTASPPSMPVRGRPSSARSPTPSPDASCDPLVGRDGDPTLAPRAPLAGDGVVQVLDRAEVQGVRDDDRHLVGALELDEPENSGASSSASRRVSNRACRSSSSVASQYPTASSMPRLSDRAWPRERAPGALPYSPEASPSESDSCSADDGAIGTAAARRSSERNTP